MSSSPSSAFVVYENGKQAEAEAALGPPEVLHVSSDWDVYGKDHFVLARFLNRTSPPADGVAGSSSAGEARNRDDGDED